MPSPPHPEVDGAILAEAMGSANPGLGSAAPPEPVRAARLLAAGNAVATRLDTWLERWFPRKLNPLAQLGPAANVMLLLATFSGVFILIWYSPSTPSAWSSLADLGPHSLGGLMRSIHRYASDLLMLLVLAHALRTLLARKFSDARWLAWVSGIALVGLIWFIGWTGYWLVWDVRAQLLALDTIRLVDVLPLFGEPMLRLFTADHTVPSLLFFVVFFLHMVLPLGIAGGLCLHLARLSRSPLLPHWRLAVWLIGTIIVAALIYPAVNAEPAHLTVKPDNLRMDWWYLWPLTITARLSGGGIWLATLLATAGLMTVPWWLARSRPRAIYQASVNISRCFACTLCSHDCPFGAITMVPRTDGKPFPAQAQIDADRCIGCGLCAGACDTQGIGLAWFDAQQVTRELENLIVTAVARGTPTALALVCAQADGGWELFAAATWERRLPGYLVRPIPCVGWVEPKLIERLISKGATAVLMVSCASSELFCREGNQWLPARLNGTREPAFRPQRADPSKMAQINFDPGQPHLLTAAALALREQTTLHKTPSSSRGRVGLVALGLTGLLLSALLVVSDAPFKNPAPAAAEFIFSFRAYGEWVSGAALALPNPTLDQRPVHMRTAQPTQRTRWPVLVQLTVDGQMQEKIFAAKGLKSDGASVGEMRVPLTPGPHEVTVRLLTQPKLQTSEKRWSALIEAQPRHLAVLTLEANRGFEFAP